MLRLLKTPILRRSPSQKLLISIVIQGNREAEANPWPAILITTFRLSLSPKWSGWITGFVLRIKMRNAEFIDNLWINVCRMWNLCLRIWIIGTFSIRLARSTSLRRTKYSLGIQCWLRIARNLWSLKAKRNSRWMSFAICGT